MMRPRALVVSLVMVVALQWPAIASHNDHDHSPDVVEVRETTLQWPVESRYLKELAFNGNLLFGSVQGGHSSGVWYQGDVPEGGFGVFRIARSGSLRQVGRLRCHSSTEVSVWGDLVMQGSLQSQRAWFGVPMDECDRSGLRLINVSDPRRPREVKFVEVACGVAGHALVPDEGRLYLYAPSSCQDEVEGPQAAGFTNEMAVIRIFPAAPRRSRMASIVDINPMIGCEWVAVSPARDLGACAADNRFVLLDISDRASPEPITGSLSTIGHSIDSVVFSWNGSTVAFGAKGRNEGTKGPSVTIYDVEDRDNPVPVGTWTVPDGPGVDQQVSSVSFVPMRDGREVITAAHGTRGVWLVDVTDPASPRELANYIGMDTSSVYVPNKEPSFTRSAYWYNGRFYSADETRLRAFRVRGFNPQTVHYFRGRYNPQTVLADFR